MTGPLGDGDYAVRFVRRRTLLEPATPIGEISPQSGSWARALLTTTDGSAGFGIGDSATVDILNKVVQQGGWRTEMEFWRDPGGLVWCGPVLDVIANPDTDQATVTAKDMSAWWAMRGLFQKIVHRQVDLAVIFAEYIAIGFDADDPGVTVNATPIGVLGDRTIAAGDLKMLGDVLPELATSGVDWTVTNRTFWVGGTEISTAPRLAGELVDEHFAADPQTHMSGAGQINDARVRANKIVGHFGGPDDDGVLLQGVQDQSTIGDQGSADWAAESWWDRVHDPLLYVDGDNALSPTAPVDIQELVPGVLVFCNVEGGGVCPVRRLQRLEQVAATIASDGGESVSVTLQPPGSTQDA